ncbi:alpha/beta fold hydrolase [Chitinasiproducens palmae]|nr:alpha/beta hydrolase [Chitinasiproducens palmae]
MFDNFQSRQLVVNGVRLHVRVGGEGPPLVLLHGHPQTHAMWHLVAPTLAQRFTVVLPDLRGYGDSDRPSPGADSGAHTKRAMAADVVGVMKRLGFDRFAVGAHDRGARVAHRLALDHPAHVQRMLLLDIAPTLDMYEQTTEAFARAYWHWFFLIQPAPLPERLIEADPIAYLRDVMGRRHAGLAVFSNKAMCEYERCIAIPGTASAICSDYRASAGIDLLHDRADRDAGRRIVAPLRVLWGDHGVVGRCFDVLSLWRSAASGDVSGDAVQCGHYLAEEAPERIAEEMARFFAS